MDTTLQSGRPRFGVGKPIWAAVGVLGVTVVALAGALIHVHSQPADPSLEVVPATQSLQANETMVPAGHASAKPLFKPMLSAAGPAQSLPTPESTGPEPKSEIQKAIKRATQPPVRAPKATGVVAQAPARPVCTICGTVESVRAVQHEGQPSGVGVVAGGVLGAVLGNQVGGGTGRAVATVAGAVGGGWAGNKIEKNMKRTTSYQVQVRMEDGRVKTVEQPSAFAVGSRVTLDRGVLRPAVESVLYPAPQPAPTDTASTRG